MLLMPSLQLSKHVYIGFGKIKEFCAMNSIVIFVILCVKVI
ncbi:hypothetical protein DCAR_0311311 [Daucus carota subsp. sativus]|uniref:Uncharacterized protein n=1 Tax=Daucus carota subsp. sativus TaxID=79200 RepID=A0AAF1AQT3_DAUCS|nr:hypothetical protein DCAR_0311311 [Daucus carota subsp. sativus]